MAIYGTCFATQAPDSADVCRKRSMLEAEGVKFVGDKVTNIWADYVKFISLA